MIKNECTKTEDSIVFEGDYGTMSAFVVSNTHPSDAPRCGVHAEVSFTSLTPASATEVTAGFLRDVGRLRDWIVAHP